jgi:glycine betaine/proline transport system ATP-binding protein
VSVVAFEAVDILFGGGRRGTAALNEALKLLDDGRSRDETLSRTGVIVGVAGANLQVAQGQICVLMGLSGSGKSTLLRAVNRLNRVTRGRVLVAHENQVVDMVTCSEAVLRTMRTRRIAMVFQQFALLPWRTVRENVGLGLELRGVPAAERRRVVDEKLKLVALDKWADKYARELSGGMQQRVGLARAFATDADILLMDEPFSALDPLIRNRLQDELLALQKEFHKTIIFVSHDLDEALKLGNQIAILEGGRIIQSGSCEDIVLRPATGYVKDFVQHMNPLNVLRGRTVMTPAERLARQDDVLALDAAGMVWLQLDGAGGPLSARCDGREARLVPVPPDAEAEIGRGDFAVASCETLMKAVIRLRQATGNPVLLVEDGRLVGICGEEEILAALSTDAWRAEVGMA